MAGKWLAPRLQQALVVAAVGAEERRGGIAAQEDDRRRFGAGGQRARDAEDKENGADKGRHGQSHSFGWSRRSNAPPSAGWCARRRASGLRRRKASTP